MEKKYKEKGFNDKEIKKKMLLIERHDVMLID